MWNSDGDPWIYKIGHSNKLSIDACLDNPYSHIHKNCPKRLSAILMNEHCNQFNQISWKSTGLLFLGILLLQTCNNRFCLPIVAPKATHQCTWRLLFMSELWKLGTLFCIYKCIFPLYTWASLNLILRLLGVHGWKKITWYNLYHCSICVQRLSTLLMSSCHTS